MGLTIHPDPRHFLASAAPFLEEREAENSLILGVAAGMADAPQTDAFFATMERNGRMVAAAMRTPPFNVVVTRAPDPVLIELADTLYERDLLLPGVLAPKREAESFARIWSIRAGTKYSLARHERIYKLREVISPPPVEGTFRRAVREDIALIAEWMEGFGDDISQPLPPDRCRQLATSAVEEGRIYLWETDRRVSMAAWRGRTRHGVGINYVYTPVELRGRGYASACVAALSRLLLNSGRRHCFLFTDLSNPTSNSIYQKIGYRPVCDVDEYRFHSIAR